MIPVVSFTISFVSIPCCLFILHSYYYYIESPGILWIGHHNMIFSLINIVFSPSIQSHSIWKTAWPFSPESPALLRGLKGLYNKEYHTELALSNLKEQSCEWATDCRQVSSSRYIRKWKCFLCRIRSKRLLGLKLEIPNWVKRDVCFFSIYRIHFPSNFASLIPSILHNTI